MSRAGPVGRNRSWTADRYIAACRPWSVILFRWVCGMRVMRLRARRRCRSQVIGDRVGWCCPQFGDQWAEIFVGEAVGLEPKQRQRGEQGMAAPLTPGAGLGCGCRSRW